MSATERCKALFVLRVGKGLRESMNGRLVKRRLGKRKKKRLGSGVSEGGVSPLFVPYAASPSSITPAPIFSKI